MAHSNANSTVTDTKPRPDRAATAAGRWAAACTSSGSSMKKPGQYLGVERLHGRVFGVLASSDAGSKSARLRALPSAGAVRRHPAGELTQVGLRHGPQP
jgi:hypothetical protein